MYIYPCMYIIHCKIRIILVIDWNGSTELNYVLYILFWSKNSILQLEWKDIRSKNITICQASFPTFISIVIQVLRSWYRTCPIWHARLSAVLHLTDNKFDEVERSECGNRCKIGAQCSLDKKLIISTEWIGSTLRAVIVRLIRAAARTATFTAGVIVSQYRGQLIYCHR